MDKIYFLRAQITAMRKHATIFKRQFEDTNMNIFKGQVLRSVITTVRGKLFEFNEAFVVCHLP